MDAVQDVLQRALALDLKCRAQVAEKLLGSLEDLTEEEVESLWLDEAERRIRDYRTGRVKAISAHDVLKEAEERLR